jgi:hypothetical protein
VILLLATSRIIAGTGVGVIVGVTVTVGLGLAVGVGVREAVGVGLEVGVLVRVGVRVGVGVVASTMKSGEVVGLSVTDPVALGLGLGLGLGDGVSTLGLGDGVAVSVLGSCCASATWSGGAWALAHSSPPRAHRTARRPITVASECQGPSVRV